MRRISISIIVIVVGIIVMIFSSSVARGQRKRSDAVYKELLKARQELAMARAMEERIGKIKGYMEMARKAMGIPPGSPPESYTFWFLSRAVALANESRVSFDSITPGLQKKGESFTEFPFQMELKGSYHGIGRFIAGLESLEQVVEVEEFAISGDPANPRLCRAKCLVKMVVF
jgi:hypothetical protein